MINWKRLGEKRAKFVRFAFVSALVAMLGAPVSVFAASDTQTVVTEAAVKETSGEAEQSVSAEVPETAPTPETTPEATPIPTPEATPEATPTPETTPEATPTPTPETTPEATPTPTPETTPEATPTPTPETTPEATPTPTPETTPEATPTPETTPEATPTPTPETTPEATPTPTPETTPTPENTPSAPAVVITPPKVSIENTPWLFHTIQKNYALVQVNTYLNVREGKGTSYRVVGTIPKNGLCYVIADADSEWIYIESGDVRGFVSRQYLLTGEAAANAVATAGEDSYVLAEAKVEPWDNEAYTYSYDTVKSVLSTSAFRNSVLTYAQQFLGNPYVWGGTSLTDGADCSGFVQQIFANFGYQLPRTSREQAQAGEKISLEEAQPGDLVFYQRDNGYIYHVMIYLGDGKVIHASTEKTGIIISDYNYSRSTGYAVRVIEEDMSAITINSGENYVQPNGQYLGKFKLTAYCNCPICCGKWSGGPTASGTEPTQGRTVAIAGLPFGTKLNIGGQVFTVEDRGTPYGHVDVYMNSHEQANIFGVQYADVYLQN